MTRSSSSSSLSSSSFSSSSCPAFLPQPSLSAPSSPSSLRQQPQSKLGSYQFPSLVRLSTPTTLSVMSPESLWESSLTSTSTFLSEASSSGVVFEPRFDAGALVGLISIAAVVTVFWLRVFVAITDREKREKVKTLRQEVYLKRVTGALATGEDDALKAAEEEQEKAVLGPVGTFIRRFRLVTEKKDNNKDDNSGSRNPFQ